MRRWRGNHPFPLDGRALAQRRAAANCRLPEDVQFVPVLTSFARRAGMLWQASAGTCSPLAVRVGAASPSRCLCRRSSSVRREPSGRAWPPSSPSSPPMRCPGSGLQRSRRLSASKLLRPPWRSRGTTASPHPAGGGGPCLRRHGILLGNQVPRRGRLHHHKGTRGARIVSARKGELMRSFREAQVRGTFPSPLRVPSADDYPPFKGCDTVRPRWVDNWLPAPPSSASRG